MPWRRTRKSELKKISYLEVKMKVFRAQTLCHRHRTMYGVERSFEPNVVNILLQIKMVDKQYSTSELRYYLLRFLESHPVRVQVESINSDGADGVVLLRLCFLSCICTFRVRAANLFRGSITR